ncbi:zinc finger protein 804A [Daubentonia madagascariensis]|uniref:Zinc finger protein 804A n=1 Tax=Daubentonia madagascariensis TaxID=31869 RepID=A0ABD2E816_DAUMA
MECYYIVISSTHLSNGHFRNIKGVFRGPLSKNGNKTLDYAEKENSIAKALEDLKANFYCELCDKQYYKHQEFDNHINSYDHAHKQRLKELKQREFARNVASKSRKDERKQEKALQRLHKLAELRKETVCAPGSGPMFKSTTVTVRENGNEISQKVVVDSVNNQRDFKYTLIHSEENTKDVTTVAVDAGSANNYTEKNTQLGDQAQGIHRHKIGFSFAFPKKASVKLESSAAAFSEYNDDASVEKGFSRKSRFVPSACHLQLSSPTDVLLSSEEKTNSFHPPEAMYTGKETAQTQEIKEVSSEKDTLLLSSICQLQLPLSSDAINYQNSVPVANQIPLEVIINEDTPMNGNGSELLGNKSTVLDMSTDYISLQATTEENVKNNETPTIKAENKNSPETLALSNTEEDNITLHKKSGLYKRQCKPFVPVLNKHGSIVLQWPSEMLVYTTTEPSISYSCNPLCFDFKSTKVNNNLDKNKLPLKDLYSQQKEEDICKRSLSDCKDVSVAGLTDYEIGGSRNEYTQVTPLLADDTLSNSCDSGKNENMGQKYKNSSCRIRKTEKYNFTKTQIKQHTLDEKYNKIKLKDTHEYWFHKSRRKKKRRQLCQHHRGEKTKESETRCKMETDNSYTNTNGKNLVPISEKQNLVAEQLLDSHLLPDKRPKAASISLSENEEIYKTWNTKYNDNNAVSSKNHCKKNTILLNGQSNPTMVHSGKHNLTYSRTYCCWKAKMSSCSQHHRCLVFQNDMKCMSQNQAVKRGYSSLMNESERFRRKRRQHSYSYSSDESLNQQNYLPEEFLRPPSASVTPCKPKKKRRRKRSRFHTEFENLEPKENTDYPVKGNSPLNHLDRLTSEDKKEEMKPQEVANIEKNSEQTDQVKNKLTLHPSNPLPSETSGETGHLVMEIAPGELSEVSSDPTTPVCVASTPTKEVIDNTLLEHKERSENVNLNEKHIPFKVPNTERNFRQSPPKSYLCHHELAEALPQGKMNEAPTEWLRYNSGILNTQAPLPFKEAHVSGHTFVTTEQILAPLALPEQALLIPLENHDKFKNLPCEVYQHIIQPNMLANKVKLTFPPAALPAPSTPLQPLPLQQPLCSTSVTTIHHTVLQQHAAAAAAAAAATAAGTFKVLQPHQQFLSQVPALTRTSLPQISVGPVGPRLCPGNQPPFVASPQMPIIPASVLHPSHLAFPPLPHTLFPSLLSPHPTVIPLQPLF